jgi:uncharacterized protein (DUF983 family)
MDFCAGFDYTFYMTQITAPSERHFSLALLWRGFRKTCPQCGVGKLLYGYLKPHTACASCKEDFSYISADDGPAWLTLLVIGHAVVPLMLVLGRDDAVPLWVAIMVLAVVTSLGVYVLLPRAKGIFIALIWLTGATGNADVADPTSHPD